MTKKKTRSLLALLFIAVFALVAAVCLSACGIRGGKDTAGGPAEEEDMSGDETPEPPWREEDLGDDGELSDGKEENLGEEDVFSVEIFGAPERVYTYDTAELHARITKNGAETCDDAPIYWGITEGGELAVIDCCTGVLTAGGTEGEITVRAECPAYGEECFDELTLRVADGTMSLLIFVEGRGGETEITVSVGDTVKFEATYLRGGESVEISAGDISWKSSNPSAGIMTADGVFTATAAEPTSINASYRFGESEKDVVVSDSVKVTVEEMAAVADPDHAHEYVPVIVWTPENRSAVVKTAVCVTRDGTYCDAPEISVSGIYLSPAATRETTEATCTAPHMTLYSVTFYYGGKEYFDTEWCPTIFLEGTNSALGHDWGEYEEINPAGCLSAGLQRRTCRRCGESEDGKTTPLGHDWDSGTVFGDVCTGAGEIIYACTRDGCGAERTEEADTLGHMLVGTYAWGEWTYKCVRGGCGADFGAEPAGYAPAASLTLTASDGDSLSAALCWESEFAKGVVPVIAVTCDILLSSSAKAFGRDKTLDLSGHTVSGAERVISVSGGTCLTVTGGGEIMSEGTAVVVSGGTLRLAGGTISGETAVLVTEGAVYLVGGCLYGSGFAVFATGGLIEASGADVFVAGGIYAAPGTGGVIDLFAGTYTENPNAYAREGFLGLRRGGRFVVTENNTVTTVDFTLLDEFSSDGVLWLVDVEEETYIDRGLGFQSGEGAFGHTHAYGDGFTDYFVLDMTDFVGLNAEIEVTVTFGTGSIAIVTRLEDLSYGANPTRGYVLKSEVISCGVTLTYRTPKVKTDKIYIVYNSQVRISRISVTANFPHAGAEWDTDEGFYESVITSLDFSDPPKELEIIYEEGLSSGTVTSPDGVVTMVDFDGNTSLFAGCLSVSAATHEVSGSVTNFIALNLGAYAGQIVSVSVEFSSLGGEGLYLVTKAEDLLRGTEPCGSGIVAFSSDGSLFAETAVPPCGELFIGYGGTVCIFSISVECPKFYEAVISPAGERYTLETGEALELSVLLYENFTPYDGSDFDAVWSSSDVSVAYVDGKGCVIAAGAGNAQITVSCTREDGCTVSASVTVAVPEPPKEGEKRVFVNFSEGGSRKWGELLSRGTEICFDSDGILTYVPGLGANYYVGYYTADGDGCLRTGGYQAYGATCTSFLGEASNYFLIDTSGFSYMTVTVVFSVPGTDEYFFDGFLEISSELDSRGFNEQRGPGTEVTYEPNPVGGDAGAVGRTDGNGKVALEWSGNILSYDRLFIEYSTSVDIFGIFITLS